MMDYCVSLLLLVVILILSSWYLIRGRVDSYSQIPGPKWKLPIFGHLHLLGSKPHLSLTTMRQQYGDVFKMNLGGNIAVVLGGKETIKSACALGPLIGRPHHLFNSWKKHARYFAFGDSEICIKYRKLSLVTMASFIKRHEKLTQVLEEETNLLIEQLCANTSDSLSHQKDASLSVSSVMYYLCFGEKGKTDGDFKDVMASIEDILNFAKQASIADTFTWATWIPSVRKKFNLFNKAQDNLVRLVKRQEKVHDKQLPNERTSDIMNEFKDVSNTTTTDYQKEETSGIGTPMEQTGMLLVAGCETVATTLNWAILLLAAFPEVQERLYQEQDTDEEQYKLVYTEAFILEVLRFSMASPLAMPHMTLDDVNINGYLVPRNTLVLINLWSGSRDTSVWGDNAEKFKPERFLTKDGTGIVGDLADCIQAFGSGRRRCVGEMLARAELIFYIKAISKSTVISLKNPERMIDFWSRDAIRNKAPNVPITFSRRESKP